MDEKVLTALKIIENLESLPRDHEPDIGDLWDAITRVKKSLLGGQL